VTFLVGEASADSDASKQQISRSTVFTHKEGHTKLGT
jgi:hypothetical protein